MGHSRWIGDMLPLYGITFEMRFSGPCAPGFFHQAALSAWLRRLLDSPPDYDLHFTLDCPEQGKRHYQAGDIYRFTVFGLGETGAAWISGLSARLAAGVPTLAWDAAMPFRDNWQLAAMYGWPGGEVLAADAPLPAWDAGALAAGMDRLRGESAMAIHITSPWRVLREKDAARPLRGEMRFCRDAEQLHRPELPLWLLRIGDALRDLARRRGIEVPQRAASGPLHASLNIVWSDAAYRDRDGSSKPMGGVMGRIEAIDPGGLDDDQLAMLVLGQYLGIGQRRAFGYGRYRLIGASEQQGIARFAEGYLPDRAKGDGYPAPVRLLPAHRDEPFIRLQPASRDEVVNRGNVAGLSDPEDVDAASTADDDRCRGGEAVLLAPWQEVSRMLILCGEPAQLLSRAGRLRIERDEAVLHEVPWAHLGSVVLFGRHRITTPALQEAMRQHVPIHMSSASGRYLGSAVSAAGGSDASQGWLAQMDRFSDECWALEAAKSVIESRIRHMSETLRRRQGLPEKAWRDPLDAALRTLPQAANREVLNGIEGSATRAYFAALKTLVPEAFGFDGRKRRPPPDPFNALLSLGYTLLYAHVDTLLRADGLLPVHGFYHRPRGTHSALASDLMEPFRHVVEREALNMVQGRLLPEDFDTGDGQCLLRAAARRLYLASLSQALLRPIQAHGSAEPLPLLEHVHSQNLALRQAISGRSPCFKAWRMR